MILFKYVLSLNRDEVMQLYCALIANYRKGTSEGIDDMISRMAFYLAATDQQYTSTPLPGFKQGEDGELYYSSDWL